MSVNFNNETLSNEVVAIVKQLRNARPGGKVKAFGEDIPVQMFSAKGSPVQGTLPAVVMYGTVTKEVEGEPKLFKSQLVVVKSTIAKQGNAYFAKLDGKAIGLVKQGKFIPA